MTKFRKCQGCGYETGWRVEWSEPNEQGVCEHRFRVCNLCRHTEPYPSRRSPNKPPKKDFPAEAYSYDSSIDSASIAKIQREADKVLEKQRWTVIELGKRGKLFCKAYLPTRHSVGNRPIMSEVVACPKCHADFDGGPIPEEHRQYYSPPYRWSRRIAIYDQSKDRTVAWKCPDCGHEWKR